MSNIQKFNSESIESMLRTDRAKLKIDAKLNVSKKIFPLQKNHVSKDIPLFLQSPIINKSNKREGRIKHNWDNRDTFKIYEKNKKENNSIPEVYTNENETVESNNNIGNSAVKIHKKLINNIENNNPVEFKSDLLYSLSFRIPKINSVVKNCRNENQESENNSKNLLENNNAFNKTNKINSKLRLKKFHQTPDNRFNNLSKEEIREDFINKHKSQVDFYFPNFNNNFLSSSSLSNVNDYDISESGNPKSHKLIKLNISPNKKNESYFDSFTGIEKNYNNSTTSLNSSWSNYQERYITLKKLNQFGKKLTDFKNTLYVPAIHMDNVNINNHNDNKSFLERTRSPMKREVSITKRSSRITSPNLSIRKSKLNIYPGGKNTPISPIRIRQPIADMTKESSFFDTEKINKPNFVLNEIICESSESDSKTSFNSARFSKKEKRNKDSTKQKLFENENIKIVDKENINIFDDKKTHRKQLSLLNLKGDDFSNLISKNKFFTRDSTGNGFRKSEINEETNPKKQIEINTSRKFNKIENNIFRNNSKNQNNSTTSYQKKRNQSMPYIPSFETAEITTNNHYIHKAKQVIIDNKMNKLMKHFD